MGYDKKAWKEDKGDMGRRSRNFSKNGSRRIMEQRAIEESLGDAEFDDGNDEFPQESSEVQKDHVS